MSPVTDTRMDELVWKRLRTGTTSYPTSKFQEASDLTFLKGRNFFHTKSAFLSFKNRVIREIIKSFCSGYKRNLNNTSERFFSMKPSLTFMTSK